MSYFDTIQASLWGKPFEPAALSDDLIQMHMHQGTGPLAFPLLPMTPAMKMVCVHNMQQQVKLQHTLSVAWTALTKAGIHPILMKGASLAALYPSPEQRAWGDIDLFVGKEQYHPACAVMRETFPEALKFDEELDHYKHYNLIADGISIEIHRVTVGMQHPIDERRYAQMEAYGAAHACDLNIGGLEVKVFDPTFNALFVMLHSWEHMMTQGANIRQLCDLALLLHRYKDAIDANLLRRWLKSLHLYDVWQLYAYNIGQSIGLPREESLFYSEKVADRAERLMTDLLAGKMVAPQAEHKAVKNRILRKWHTMQERMKNAKRIRRYSPAFARHMQAETLLHGALRFFAKDRNWE